MTTIKLTERGREVWNAYLAGVMVGGAIVGLLMFGLMMLV